MSNPAFAFSTTLHFEKSYFHLITSYLVLTRRKTPNQNNTWQTIQWAWIPIISKDSGDCKISVHSNSNKCQTIYYYRSRCYKWDCAAEDFAKHLNFLSILQYMSVNSHRESAPPSSFWKIAQNWFFFQL